MTDISKPAPVCDNPNEVLPSFYSNNVETQISNMDVRFRFGQIETVDEGGALHYRNQFTLYMSRQQAAIFATQLTGMLKLIAEAAIAPAKADDAEKKAE